MLKYEIDNINYIKQINDCKLIKLMKSNTEIGCLLKGKKDKLLGSYKLEDTIPYIDSNGGISNNIYIKRFFSYNNAEDTFNSAATSILMECLSITLYKTINFTKISGTNQYRAQTIYSDQVIIFDNIQSDLNINNLFVDANVDCTEYYLTIELDDEISVNTQVDMKIDIFDFDENKLMTYEFVANLFVDSEVPGEI